MLKESSSSKKKTVRRKSPSPFSRHRHSSLSSKGPFEDSETTWAKDSTLPVPPRSYSTPIPTSTQNRPLTQKNLAQEPEEKPLEPTPPISTDAEDETESEIEEERQIYLNIGGYPYVTTAGTLCKIFSLPSSKETLPIPPGLLKTLTGIFSLTDLEIVVPEGMSTKALCREAAFYHIHFPLVEDHESLSFVTDDWLAERFENRAYRKIAPLANPILAIVLRQFKEKANKSLKIESSPFLMYDLTPAKKWLDSKVFEKAYTKFEVIDTQKKLYQGPCIVNDEYFSLLDSEENQKTIISYCNMQMLTVDIEAVRIYEPGGQFLTLGYKFVHVREEERKKKRRGSLHLDQTRIGEKK